MLSATLTLNYDETGGSTPADRVYDKKAHEVDNAFYREHDALVNNSSLEDNILLRIDEPKRTASFYGTKRHFCTLRQEETIASPSGDVISPGIIKFETSIPVGYTLVGKRALFERLKALLAHDDFEDFFFESQT